MAQRVLVTAGAGGIGLAIAEAFASDGARVHVADVNADAVRRVTGQNDAISGSVGDISKPEDLDTLFGDVQAQLGGLDVLVNNAGITANTFHPGAVEGPRIQSVFEGRAKVSGRTVEEEIESAMANQSVKKFINPADIAALALFLAGPHARTISGQMFPIDADSKAAS